MDLQFANTHIHRECRRVPMHSHPVLEIVYFIAGTGTSAFNGKRYEVAPGTITITAAGIPHDQIETTPMSSLCFGVKNSGLEDLQGVVLDPGGAVRFLAEDLMRELAARRPAFELIADGILRQMVGRIRRLAIEEDLRPRKEELVDQALDIIHQSEGNVTVAELSETLYVSHDYLRHLFREYSSKSPMKHIIEVRLNKAKHLLRHTRSPVATVAARAGFDNPYYFSRLFKQVVGVTPTQYRRS